jgi:hypothetical protein
VAKRRSNSVEEERTGFRGDSGSAPAPDTRTSAKDWGDDWVHELIEMTRPGVEINWPVRGLRERVIPFEFDDFD